MTKNRFAAAADDLRQLPGVIECVSWSDSVSVRYSGMLRTLRYRAHDHDLSPVNVDGVFYAIPMPIENDAGELVPDPNTAPPADVVEADPIATAHLVEMHGDQRLLVTTTGVTSVIDFVECGGPYGWLITEAKEAQIRFAPSTHGTSFLLGRSTSQLRRLR